MCSCGPELGRGGTCCPSSRRCVDAVALDDERRGLRAPVESAPPPLVLALASRRAVYSPLATPAQKKA
jgi:hypothetical protein